MTPKKIKNPLKKEEENSPEKVPEKVAEKLGVPVTEQRIIRAIIEDEMKASYLDYAMSVIIGRALPDIRDGLKPVHRRILFAMNDMGLRYNTPTRKSARIVGECFVKDTLITTPKGLIPIQNIKINNYVFTQNGLGRVSALFEMPKKPLIKIILTNGTKNIVTPFQKIKIINKNFEYEWKYAKDLTKKDCVVNRAIFPEIRKKVKLEKNKILNKNLAYLLGLLMSDGWIEHEKKRNIQRMGFYSIEKKVIEKIKRIIETEFQYTPTIEVREYEYPSKKGIIKRKGFTIRINRKKINDFFIKKFNLKNLNATTKHIPLQIMKSPKEIIFSFISGLIEGDGSIHKNRNVIHYGSVSTKLIDQLQILLQQLGILNRKYKGKEKKEHSIGGGTRLIKEKHSFYYLEIRGSYAHSLAKKINLQHSYKNKILKTMPSKRILPSAIEETPFASRIIFNTLSKHHLGGGWYKYQNGKKFRLGIKYKTGCKIRYSKDLKNKKLTKSQIKDWNILEKLKRIEPTLFLKLKKLIDNDIYFLKIKETQKTKSEKTYDLQVENKHEFIANGMISHNCLGKYHPHGDMAVYDALARMAQDFSLRYPLVIGQGNWGSIDGDSQAAMRYTEAKLAKISDEMLTDIDKDTVEWQPNFDGSLKEPLVLPSKIPNLLVNGSSGIAVGMATNIPPHNLKEVCQAVVELIDKPSIEVQDIINIIQGPDFPTAGLIMGKRGIIETYNTGKGLIRVRGKLELEEKKNKQSFIITQIPYQLNKSQLIEQIADAVNDRTIQGISDIRDESDRKGMRIVLELRKSANIDIVKNQLYKHTRLQSTFGAIMLGLDNGQPKILNIKKLLESFLIHRRVVVRRRTKFDLRKAEERAHILKGLIVALQNLDPVVKLIKTSKNPAVAKKNLIAVYKLSDKQSQAILDMKLQRLTGLEQQKIKDEHKHLLELIRKLKEILADEKKILNIIKDEMKEIMDKYGDDRRTVIEEVEEEEIAVEDLIKPEENVITISHAGYIKRQSIDVYKTQRRGGKGVIGATTREEDFIKHLFVANTHSYLLVFTDKGKVYWLKVYNIPEAARVSKGKPIVNLIRTEPDEKIQTVIPIREFDDKHYLLFATRKGLAKKTKLSAYSRPRKAGIIAINLNEGDGVVEVILTDGHQKILIASSNGQAVKFFEADARHVGRNSYGVRGIRLGKDDKVIGMIIAQDNQCVLTITENGYGKRTNIEEYRLISRGGKGVRNIICSERNGKVKCIRAVKDDDEIMVVSKKGILIRVPVKNISVIGRNTQGVRIMKLGEEDHVVSVAKIEANGNDQGSSEDIGEEGEKEES
ncbi:DNA gyrase subunit A [Candidatus Woesearchaeota archaeon]|nr:DNA gyrase subunit A [Candidatus Woesearchaeota archaeon]